MLTVTDLPTHAMQPAQVVTPSMCWGAAWWVAREQDPLCAHNKHVR